MPNRIIRESINESEGLSSLSINAIDLFKRLITYGDDYGRFNANLEIVRARLYPLEVDIVTTADIHDWLGELCGIGKIAFYTAKHDNGPVPKIFGYMVGWKKHQRIRNSRNKCPEPGDEINDWALQRFVPIAMKIEIYKRDQFECQECRKSFALPGTDTKRAIRLVGGLLHIDHVVTVKQGGRATLENLRLLCESCNLRRPRKPSCAELSRLAASCGEARPKTALSDPNPNPNPIQSDPISLEEKALPAKAAETHDKTAQQDMFNKFWTSYPRKTGRGAAEKAWSNLKPNAELLAAILAAIARQKLSHDWTKDGGEFIPHPTTWLNQRRWMDEPFVKRSMQRAASGFVG